VLAVALLAAQAQERQDGPFLWIALGLLLGAVVGFLYAAVRHLLRRRGPGRSHTDAEPHK
jgi:hypothetical protein